MNGAESLMRALAGAGVEFCFTNPGTTEIHLVAALEQTPGIRGVLGLFEGVCSGAADGYARMAGKPAATLLHLGPGLANALANFHNARRAHSPVVNLVGDHPAFHRLNDPPLHSDIATMAAPVSVWVRDASVSSGLGADGFGYPSPNRFFRQKGFHGSTLQWRGCRAYRRRFWRCGVRQHRSFLLPTSRASPSKACTAPASSSYEVVNR